MFRTFKEPEAHYRWFVSGKGWEISSFTHDFKVGGHEHGKFHPEGHPSTCGNDTWYLEIDPDRRIVNACTMSLDGKPVSHSLAIVELRSEGAGGCRLVYTEQGAYYGDACDAENRRTGCAELFGKLEIELRDHP